RRVQRLLLVQGLQEVRVRHLKGLRPDVTMRAVRPIAAGASVLVAIALCVQAWCLARADSIVSEANAAIDGPSWRKVAPPLEPWLKVRSDLLEAEQLAPANPGVSEALGVLHA